jgi:hypothetical protein
MNMYYSRAVSSKKVKNLALCDKLNCAEYTVTFMAEGLPGEDGLPLMKRKQ